MPTGNEIERSSIRMGSDRSFGVVFFGLFLLIALWPLTGDGQMRLWAMLIAVTILGIALIKPRVLKPLNMLWFKVGLILGRIVTPIVLGILFFGAVLPTGLALRLFGKDPRSRAIDQNARSYWISVKPGSVHRSMKNQF